MNTPFDWLKQFIFIATRKTVPDGRPLYAYKCSDKRYAELKAMTHNLIAAERRGQDAPSLARLFCLFAAETFCREHESGPWAWESVFRPLSITPPTPTKIGEWVERGLDWWRRPLLRGTAGDRQFLVTIACEGGLPLKLLRNDNARLTQFFRSVLESYHSQAQRGVPMA